MATKTSVDLLAEISSKRANLEALSKRIDDMTNIVEVKIKDYISRSPNLPSVATTAEILNSITSLYNASLSTNDRILRSLEKQLELEAKYGEEAVVTDDDQVTHASILKALEATMRVKAPVEESDSSS